MYFYAVSRAKYGGSPGVGKRVQNSKKHKPRGFAGGLDGHRLQIRVMAIRVEKGQAQTQCQEIESVRSALHTEMCDELLVRVFRDNSQLVSNNGFLQARKPVTSSVHALRTPLYAGIYSLTCSQHRTFSKIKNGRTKIHRYMRTCVH